VRLMKTIYVEADTDQELDVASKIVDAHIQKMFSMPETKGIIDMDAGWEVDDSEDHDPLCGLEGVPCPKCASEE
jgi:hypothetical protein